MIKKNKKAQESKYKILKAIPKKAQEEIAGFTMIIVLVAVILLIFVTFSIKGSEKSTLESYEIEGFLSSLMQKTSDCRDTNNFKYYSVKELMYQCSENQMCMDNRKTCNVLSKEIEKVSNESWNIKSQGAIKGYLFNITADGDSLLSAGYGNRTRSSKGAVQDNLLMHGKEFRIDFIVFY